MKDPQGNDIYFTDQNNEIYNPDNRIAHKLDDMPKLIDAIDNLIHAVNNLSVVVKEKGNKYGY